MTAQATTAGQPEAQVEDQAQPQAGTQDQTQATPEGQANPEATSEVGQPELDKQIETAEKRAADKQAYLDKLQGELKEYDRSITDHKQKLKSSAPQPQAPQQDTRPADPGLTDAQAEVAQTIGLSGDQFLNLLRDNPDQAVAAIVDAAEQKAEKRIMNQLPLQLERQRIEDETRGKIMSIQQELGQEEFPLFTNAVHHYQQQGFIPTPDHIMNEIKYGSPEQQRKLMEYGLSMIQQQNAVQPASDQNAPEQGNQNQAPGVRPFPTVPGGGNPVQPQGGQQQANNRRLPGSWNV